MPLVSCSSKSDYPTGFGLFGFARVSASCNLPRAGFRIIALCTSHAAMLFLANVRLGVRELGVRVDPARRKGVGNRRGGGVRGLALAGFTVI